jgi:hypothetical protein
MIRWFRMMNTFIVDDLRTLNDKDYTVYRGITYEIFEHLPKVYFKEPFKIC